MVTAVQGVLMEGTVGPTVQTRQPLSIGRGESVTINLAVVKPDASARDLSALDVFMRVERRDGSELVKRLATIISAIGGTAQLKILTSETMLWAAQLASYVIWVTDVDDESYPVILRSEFTIEDRGIDVDSTPTTPAFPVSLLASTRPRVCVGAVVSGTYAKAAGVDNKVTQFLTTDTPDLIVGVFAADAVDGATVLVSEVRGQQVSMKLDSAGGRTAGQIAYLSQLVNGALSADSTGIPVGPVRVGGSAGTTVQIAY